LEGAVEDPLTALVDTTGCIRVKRQAKKGKMPRSAEELRRKLLLLSTAHTCMLYRNPGRSYLSTTSADAWLAHVNFILGEEVAFMTVPLSAVVPWQLVLNWEFQVRKEAYRLVCFEQTDLAEALVTARHDTQLKQLHWLTPLCMQLALQRPDSPGVTDTTAPLLTRQGNFDDALPGTPPKTKAKVSAKAKAKAKPGVIKHGKIKKVGDKGICWAFNDKGCVKVGCTWAHSCWNCGEGHAGSACTVPA
jgi:hypothetical protein